MNTKQTTDHPFKEETKERTIYGYETASPELYPILKNNARKNRREMTASEVKLWDELRKLPFRFRRQHPIDDYIADFICLPCRLVIEVDGEYHETPEQREQDEIRSQYIERRGFQVIRFTNEQVNDDIQAVIEEIKKVLYDEE